MSNDFAKESQELVEKNENMLKELDQTIHEQRSQISNIEAELEKLGLTFSDDLPIDQLSDEQKAQLDALQADIDRIESEATAPKAKAAKPRTGRMMV